MTEDRPVHVVLSGNDIQTVPLTDAEWEIHKTREAVAIQARHEHTAKVAADQVLIAGRAQEDPAFAALARALGYLIPEGGGADESASAPATSAASAAQDGTPGQGSGPAPAQ